MKKLLIALGLLTTVAVYAADVKISQLPLGSAVGTNSNDSFPYVSSSVNVTKRLTLWDIVNLPPLTSNFAPKFNPTFTGVVTAPSFVGPLTGNASTATALAANPVDCSANQFANAIAANGDLNCSRPTVSNLTALTASKMVETDGSGILAVSTYGPATSVNTVSTGVARDGSGNFSAGTITAALSGNASTATALAANPTDCSTNQFANAIAANGNLTCAQPTVSNLSALTVSKMLVTDASGVITTSSFAPATNLNTVSAGVARDASGNFTAGTITAALTGTASGNTAYTANNHGVVVSGSANTMTVIAPDSSTTKALISGGASADPAWGTLAIGGGGTGQTTKAAAFDALSPMTTIGDIIYGGTSGTGTRLAGGTTGQVLTATTGAAPSWQTSSGSNSIIFKTANYTATSSDDTISCDASGGAFTISLPAAASNSGKVLNIFKSDTSLANRVTIDPNGSETINGFTTLTLATQNDSMKIQSNGTNWIILSRQNETPWATYTPTLQGFGTISSAAIYWKRQGQNLLLHGKFSLGTLTGSQLQFGFPSGLTSASSTYIPPQTQTGLLIRDANTVQNTHQMIMQPSVTYLQVGGPNAVATSTPGSPQNGTQLGNDNETMYITNVVVPIAGWE